MYILRFTRYFFTRYFYAVNNPSIYTESFRLPSLLLQIFCKYMK